MLAHLKIKNVENCEEHTKSLIWVQINSEKYSASSFKMFPERSVSCKALVKHPISFKAVFLSVFFIETWMSIMKTCNEKKILEWLLNILMVSWFYQNQRQSIHRPPTYLSIYYLPLTNRPTDHLSTDLSAGYFQFMLK